MRRTPVVPILAAAALLGFLTSVLPAAPVEAGGRAAPVYREIDGHVLRLDSFPPRAGRRPAPAVVVVHGGGWQNGHRGWWGPIAQAMTSEGWATFSVDYRLSGVAPFPAAVDDVRAAVHWIREHAGALGVDPGRIALAGGSAGGNLALLAAMGDGAVPVSAVVAWSAPTDLATLAARERLAPFIVRWLGCDPAACPARAAAASPLTYADEPAPPVLLATGATEFVPAAQSVALHERLLGAGNESQLVVIPGARHASAYRADVWDDTIAFLHTAFAR